MARKAAVTSDDAPTAVAYVRISADPDDEREGVKRQRRDMAALAMKLGATLVTIYEDNDLTASKARGTTSKWAAMLTYLDAHPDTAYVLGWRLDRLGRRMADIESLDDRARLTGLRVMTSQEGDVLANPAWPYIVAQAKSESRNTGARVRRAQEDRRRSGKDSAGGRRPYGYTPDRTNIVPDEAAVVRELYSRFLAGESLHGLMRALNERGEPTNTGSRQWTIDRVRQILTRHRYAGWLIHRGEVVGDGDWPRIIDRHIFAAVQRRIGETAKPRRGAPATTLLGGIVRCGLCQTRMVGGIRHAKPIYTCDRRGGGCGRVARLRATIEDYVLPRILEGVDRDVVAVEEAQVLTALDMNQQAQVDTELEMAVLRERFKKERTDAALYFDTQDILRRRVRTLEAEHAKLLDDLTRLAQESVAADRWQEWTQDVQRTFIRTQVAAILVHPAKSYGLAARTVTPGEIEIVPLA